jgi:hypothetical protein
MFGKPKQMVAASGLALIGALISLVSAFLTFGSGHEPMEEITAIGMLMLTAVMFLAISGSIGTNSRLSWRASMFFIFLTGLAVVATYLYGKAVEDVLSYAQIVIVLAVAMLVSSLKSSDWIELNRAA